ncbi:ABC transporter substrate-binding protein [Pseudooceanicola aestuarii]|uniref:ABC transporter substrate-binding protein n=1 Tax=Pseudooceanicola aestuarii TaxID=2697319 RepID=UPI0013D67B01|nr:ABC transporter substrate-binding protein [Pseudooceanicola aestuarii]
MLFQSLKSATLTAGLAVASSLGATTFAAAETEITFYHYQSGGNYEALRTILDDFEAANDGITVKDIFAQSQQITAEVQAALAAGRPVDVATVIGKNIVYFLNNTNAVDMVAASDGDTAWLDGYLPNFLDLGRDGEAIYAIPHAYGTPMMYYNKDIFAEAGLDPEMPPATWAEFLEAGKTITEKTGKPGGAHLHASMGDYGTMVMVTNAGATYLNADGTEAQFDSPEGIAALQNWQDMAVNGMMPIATDRSWSGAFMGGQMGMYITSSAALRAAVAASEDKFELGVANYPLFGDSPRRVNNSGAALMLYSQDADKQAASMALLRFISQKEIANRWSRASGYMPVIQDPLADPAMQEYVEGFPFVVPVIDQMSQTVPTNVWPAKGTLEAQTEIRAMLDELWAAKRPAAEIVPEAVARVNAALAANK